MHYLGIFIRYDESKRDCLNYCTSKWEKNIHTISETVGKYPQANYTVVVHAIQLEWIFLKFVTKNTGYSFAVVEKILRKNFFLASSSENRNLSHLS